MTADIGSAPSMKGPNFSWVELTFDILSKWPKNVVTQTQDNLTIVASAKGCKKENDGDHKADQSKPPAKDKSPEKIANREV
jgi:hypothetical protein